MYLKNTGFFKNKQDNHISFDFLQCALRKQNKKKTLNSRSIFSRVKFSSPHMYTENEISETDEIKPCLYTKSVSEGTNPESSSQTASARVHVSAVLCFGKIYVKKQLYARVSWLWLEVRRDAKQIGGPSRGDVVWSGWAEGPHIHTQHLQA